jgi:hypothetical protein
VADCVAQAGADRALHAQRAPATLHEVVKHYSEISPDRLHSDCEQILKPLRLSEREMEDLLVFPETLQHGGAGSQRRHLAEDFR